MSAVTKTAKRVWAGIQPGDVGFDEGTGISGLIIRLGTRSSYGHCWVYHQLLDIDANGDEMWDTVEAGPSGILHRIRTKRPNKVVRLWRDEDERRAILQASERLVGSQYGWGEIVRITCRILGIKLRRYKDNPRRVICSNHVTQAALAGRPDLVHYLRYEHFEIWPGEVALTLDELHWDTAVV